MVEWKQRVQKLGRFDVEKTWKNPHGELIDISSILKVESTSKYPRRIDVIISTWTRLSMWIELSTMANRRRFVHWVVSWAVLLYTMKPLNSGHLRFLKNLSVIERCPLLGGNMKKIVIFVVKCFVRYSWYVCYLRCPLLRGFTVSSFILLGKSRLGHAVEI